jgi:hypothetical protein
MVSWCHPIRGALPRGMSLLCIMHIWPLDYDMARFAQSNIQAVLGAGYGSALSPAASAPFTRQKGISLTRAKSVEKNRIRQKIDLRSHRWCGAIAAWITNRHCG